MISPRLFLTTILKQQLFPPLLSLSPQCFAFWIQFLSSEALHTYCLLTLFLPLKGSTLAELPSHGLTPSTHTGAQHITGAEQMSTVTESTKRIKRLSLRKLGAQGLVSPRCLRTTGMLTQQLENSEKSISRTPELF